MRTRCTKGPEVLAETAAKADPVKKTGVVAKRKSKATKTVESCESAVKTIEAGSRALSSTEHKENVIDITTPKKKQKLTDDAEILNPGKNAMDSKTPLKKKNADENNKHVEEQDNVNNTKTPAKRPKNFKGSEAFYKKQKMTEDPKKSAAKQEDSKDSKTPAQKPENLQSSKTPMKKQNANKTKKATEKQDNIEDTKTPAEMPGNAEDSKILMKNEDNFKRKRRNQRKKLRNQLMASNDSKVGKGKRVWKNKKFAKRWEIVARQLGDQFNINMEDSKRNDLKKANQSISTKVFSLLKTYKTTQGDDKGLPKGLKCGIHDVAKSIQNKEPKLVVIAGDLQPIEVIQVFPKMCGQQGVPYLVAGDTKQLGTFVGVNKCAVIAVTEATQNELRPILNGIGSKNVL